MENKAQPGYLLMSAIVLIVILGLLAATMTYLFTEGSYASVMRLDSVRAFYAARSGLEMVAYRLLSPDLSQRLSCSEVDGEYDGLPGTELFTHPYTAFFIAQATPSYINHSIVLSWGISSVSSDIPISVSDHVNLVAPRGRVLIDREAIDYRSIVDDCGPGGYSFCLTNVTRNANHTGAVAHSAGTPVSQNQCLVTVSGGIPVLSDAASDDPKPRRKLVGEVKQLEAGWLVGGRRIVRWDGAKWSQEALISGVILHDVEMLSYADVWAVGGNDSGNTVLVYLDHDSWMSLPNGFTKVLKGVTCIDHRHCHAVGDSGLFLSLSWTGVGPAWTQKGAGMTSASINSVSCSNVTCRAVGDFETLPDSSTKNVFAHWNGTDWIRTPDSDVNSNVPVENLRGISCAGSTCQAVGANSTFVRWTGSQWINVSPLTFPTGVRMNDVYCVAANDCWAVGNDGMIAHWDGGLWSVFASFGAENLNSVTCADEHDCWAVGDNRTIVHFDGATWNTNFAVDPAVATDHFRGVCFSADHSQHDIVWHEDFG
jgi:hypothetical protein